MPPSVLVPPPSPTVSLCRSMKLGGGALGRLSLPKGLHLHRWEEDPAAPQHLTPADKLPANAKSSPRQVLKQVRLRGPGQLQEETRRQKRRGWPSGHCDPSYFQESGAAGLGVEGLRPHPPQVTLGKGT